MHHRNNLRKLLDWATDANTRPWLMGFERVGSTIFVIRPEMTECVVLLSAYVWSRPLSYKCSHLRKQARDSQGDKGRVRDYNLVIEITHRSVIMSISRHLKSLAVRCVASTIASIAVGPNTV